MLTRICLAVLLLLPFGGAALAQTRVRTETIRPPATTVPAPNPAATFEPRSEPARPRATVATIPKRPGIPAELAVIADPAQLPPAVARTRERILAAARTGDLRQLQSVMQAGNTMPAFSSTQEVDPVVWWRANYPDSGGVEVLSILVTILETPAVRLDADTPDETFVWPYLANVPLKLITQPQKVELFRIVTGADYKAMLEQGRYAFYRIGIAPDGTWTYFISGN
jgi:hypothetical protein